MFILPRSWSPTIAIISEPAGAGIPSSDTIPQYSAGGSELVGVGDGVKVGDVVGVVVGRVVGTVVGIVVGMGVVGMVVGMVVGDVVVGMVVGDVVGFVVGMVVGGTANDRSRLRLPLEKTAVCSD